MANYSETAAVLARWRDVERQLEAAVANSREAEHLQAEAARLRDEIQRITQPEGRIESPAEA